MLAAAVIFVVSCGGKKKTEDNPDTGETVTDEDTADTEPAGDTEPTGDTEAPDDADTTSDDADTAAPDPCSDDPCAGIENATGCISHEGYYECECIENYAWDWETEKCFDPCDPNPCNDMPDSDGKCSFNENKNDYYRYTCGCLEHYQWSGSSCEVERRVVQCEGLPQNAEWAGSSEVNQNWNPGAEDYSPSAEGKYNEKNCWNCCFECKEGYFWNGSECVDPCYNNPCATFDLAQDGACYPISYNDYICGCEQGYFWNGTMLGCTGDRPAFGNLRTGETRCYGYDLGYNSNIECPVPGEDLYGQDPQYAGSPHFLTQYFEEGGETLTSVTTGLEWSRKISENTLSYAEAAEYCESLNAQQNAGWRLPNIHELMTMLFDKSFKTYFGDYTNVDYWSNSGITRVWVANISYSKSLKLINVDSDSKAYALCVRGDELSDFQDLDTWVANGTEVYSDPLTKLMWMKTGAPDKNRRQALEYCENLIHAGYSDWRLPNENELMSVLIPLEGIMLNAKYWTSSYIKMVNFYPRYELVQSEATNKYSALCVRSALCRSGYFWDGEDCVADPCNSSSCSITNSTGSCIPKTAETYECVCSEGYFWDGSACVTPCRKNGSNPCAVVADSNGTCIAGDLESFYCGCTSGYLWDGKNCTASDSAKTQVNKIYNVCTEQTKCYNSSAEITCPAEGESFYGQDAQFRNNSCTKKSFTQGINDEEMYIIDSNNGLEWSGVSEKFYNWNEAQVYCGALNYAGRKDWRVPNMYEMQMISFDDQLFKNIFNGLEETAVWTVSSKTAYSDTVWAATPDPDGKPGFSYKEPKINTNHVLCVRGKQISPAWFTTKISNSQEYLALTSSGTAPYYTKVYAEEKTWEEALAYCENLNYAGSDAWHLPNINELSALVNYSRSAPASEFPGLKANGKFWSSTTYSSYNSSAYYLDFSEGLVKSDYLKTSKKDVICIRY